MARPDFSVSPMNETSFACSGCHATTRRVWGEVIEGGVAHAVYYVTWCKQSDQHHARFDLIIGRWGEDASADDRHYIAIEFRVVAGEPSFMVIDAEPEPYQSLASTALRRSDVIGTPDQTRVFGMLDAIWLGDRRVDEMREDAARAAHTH